MASPPLLIWLALVCRRSSSNAGKSWAVGSLVISCWFGSIPRRISLIRDNVATRTISRLPNRRLISSILKYLKVCTPELLLLAGSAAL